jgi:hypothetical protein
VWRLQDLPGAVEKVNFWGKRLFLPELCEKGPFDAVAQLPPEATRPRGPTQRVCYESRNDDRPENN